MRHGRATVTGLIAAASFFIITGVLTGALPLPWGSGTTEARTIVLGDATFAPVEEPPGFHLQGGASPHIIFQGVLTNPLTGAPVPDGSYSTTFRIFDAAASGNQLWTETQNVSVSQGLMSVALGSVTPLTSSLFTSTPRFLEVQVSGDPAMTPRFPFEYVPYAFSSEQAGALSRLGFSTTAVDSANNVGEYASVTIGVDGLPVISYYDNTNDDLKVAHCGNAACTAGNVSTTVDSAGLVGLYTSITIGNDSLPVVSYYDDTNDDLKVAHCGNAACTAGNTVTTVDSAGNVGNTSSITIGRDGLPVISYLDLTGIQLKSAHCGNATCTAGNTLAIVDTAGFVGEYSSITIGAGGPLISYSDSTDGDLLVAECHDPTCSALAPDIHIADSANNVGPYTSITIGSDGLPIVSYWDLTNSALKVAHCSNVACFAGATSTGIDTSGQNSSITIGSDGLPVISYQGVGNVLKVAHCGNVTCTSGIGTGTITETVDSVGGNSRTSITIGSDGLPLIAYYDATNDDLKVAHCSNPLCTPFHRRR
jgi:predicted regulator of Ras-like GTPase activity (Roadblock/LC7/MglB family)